MTAARKRPERMVKRSELQAADEARAHADAARDQALDSLQALVLYIKRVGGFMTWEDQATLREAEARLVEAGRKP